MIDNQGPTDEENPRIVGSVIQGLMNEVLLAKVPA